MDMDLECILRDLGVCLELDGHVWVDEVLMDGLQGRTTQYGCVNLFGNKRDLE